MAQSDSQGDTAQNGIGHDDPHQNTAHNGHNHNEFTQNGTDHNGTPENGDTTDGTAGDIRGDGRVSIGHDTEEDYQDQDDLEGDMQEIDHGDMDTVD